MATVFQIIVANRSGEVSAGSGVASHIDEKDGNIVVLTNAHVTRDAQLVALRTTFFPFGLFVSGRVVGYGDTVDVSVIKLEDTFGGAIVTLDMIDPTYEESRLDPEPELVVDVVDTIVVGFSNGLNQPIFAKGTSNPQFLEEEIGLVYQTNAGVSGGISGGPAYIGWSNDLSTGSTFYGLVFAGLGEDMSFIVPRPSVLQVMRLILEAETPPPVVIEVRGPFITYMRDPDRSMVGRFITGTPLQIDNVTGDSVTVRHQDGPSLPLQHFTIILDPGSYTDEVGEGSLFTVTYDLVQQNSGIAAQVVAVGSYVFGSLNGSVVVKHVDKTDCDAIHHHGAKVMSVNNQPVSELADVVNALGVVFTDNMVIADHADDVKFTTDCGNVLVKARCGNP